MRNRWLVMDPPRKPEPPRQQPSELLPIPILYVDPGQLEAVRCSPNNASKVRASASKSGFPNYSSRFCSVVRPSAVRIGETGHWTIKYLFQLGFALLYLVML